MRRDHVLGGATSDVRPRNEFLALSGGCRLSGRLRSGLRARCRLRLRGRRLLGLRLLLLDEGQDVLLLDAAPGPGPLNLVQVDPVLLRESTYERRDDAPLRRVTRRLRLG